MTTQVVNTRPASGRPACTVGLDLRRPGRARAVAVDRRGRLRAWAGVSGGGGRMALARRALEPLAVRPKALRVLLGEDSAQVGCWIFSDAPDAEQITETLLGEGYEPLERPAVTQIESAPGVWLVAASDEESLLELADALCETTAVEPDFSVDQLLLAARFGEGAAVLENTVFDDTVFEDTVFDDTVSEKGGDERWTLFATPGDSTPFHRQLAGSDAVTLAAEIREEVTSSGGVDRALALGAGSERGAQILAEAGLEVVPQNLPAVGGETLPGAFAMAWMIAAGDPAPALAGPRLARRGKSLRLARGAFAAGLVLGLIGLLLVLSGARSWWSARSDNHQALTEMRQIAAQIAPLEQIASLVGEIERLREEEGQVMLPWPALTPTLVALAENRPAAVGWRRLAIEEGAVELTVETSIPAPEPAVERMRYDLEELPAVVSVSWEEPERKSGRRLQTVRAQLRSYGGPGA